MHLDFDTLKTEMRRGITVGVTQHGMIVGNVSWIIMVLMMGMLCTRLAVKVYFIGRRRRPQENATRRGFFGTGLDWDDVCVGLAAVFGIAQTAAVSVQAMRTLGRHSKELSAGQMPMFEKAEYASQLFYIASMGCARLSASVLLAHIVSGLHARRTALALTIFSALWTVSGVLVAAFPCSLPKTWEVFGDECIDTVTFVNYIGATNIIGELLLVVIPLAMWDVALSTQQRRFTVTCVFLTRLSVVVPLSAHLVVFNRHSRTKDITYDRWSATLCMQLAQHLSIITACLPCLHPFIVRVLRKRADEMQQRREQDVMRTSNGGSRWRGLTSQHQGTQNKQQTGISRLDSHSSNSPGGGEQDLEAGNEMPDRSGYCRPLATYGLDRSSAHLHSPHFNRFPTVNEVTADNHRGDANVPHGDCFMRPVPIPDIRTRPITICDANGFPIGFEEGPARASQIGVLPDPDWDTESEIDRSSRAGSEKSGKSGNSKGAIWRKADDTLEIRKGRGSNLPGLEGNGTEEGDESKDTRVRARLRGEKVVSVAVSKTTGP